MASYGSHSHSYVDIRIQYRIHMYTYVSVDLAVPAWNPFSGGCVLPKSYRLNIGPWGLCAEKVCATSLVVYSGRRSR